MSDGVVGVCGELFGVSQTESVAPTDGDYIDCIPTLCPTESMLVSKNVFYL